MIALTAPANAVAQDTRYRVEILVLTHLHGAEPAAERNWIADYSKGLDLHAPAEEEDLEEGGEDATDAGAPAAVDPEGSSVAELAASGAEGGDARRADVDGDGASSEGEPPESDANAVVPITGMSAVMEEAWRRLRLSAPFRPEQYLAWEQGDSPPFPRVRIHDAEVILEDDPWAAFRLELLEEADGPATPMGAPAADGSRFYGDAAATFEQEQVSPREIPPPTRYYRIDGEIQLLRKRFLHLDIDLQLREAVYAAPPVSGTLPAATPPGGAPPHRQPVSFRVYELGQSRQVKTGRMEYFDSPKLGVLAWITAVEVEPQTDDSKDSP